MAQNTIEGCIISVEEPRYFETQKGEGKTTDFIIETYGDYPKKVCFNVWGDKIDLSKLNAGDMVKVYFDISSRQWNNRWITTANCYRLDAVSHAKNISPQYDNIDDTDNTNDGLPF